MYDRHLRRSTSDGSDTVYDTLLQAHYHSLYGAVTEARYVFVEAGLSYVHSLNPKLQPLRLLEVGLGVGLNAAMAWQYSLRWQLRLQYEALEPNPVPADVCGKLNYAAWLPELRFMALHEEPWNRKVALDDRFSLTKSRKKWPLYKPKHRFHLIFYDPFSSEVQADCWQAEAAQKAYEMLEKDGVLVTYSVQSDFRRAAAAAGFQIDLRKGPPGKRQMLRAIK